MSITKVIFLDVDGVLGSERVARARIDLSPGDRPYDVWDPIAVLFIKCLCIQHDARIVWSSTWRLSSMRKRLMEKIQEWDLQTQCHPDDFCTPVLCTKPDANQEGRRGCEIAEWLNEHPEVTNYIIIDDDSDMKLEQIPYLFLISGKEGMQANDYWRITEYCERHWK